MASTGDILQIVQHFSQAGNEALLVNFYEVTQIGLETLSESQVAESFHELFGASILTTFLHTSAQYNRTVVDNLTGGGFFGDYSNTINGVVTGEPFSSPTAISVKQNVGNRITRNGFKRLPFLGEGLGNGNEVVMSSGPLASVEAWFGAAITINNPIDDEPTLLLQPVVVGRTETPPDSGIYILDLAKINTIVNAQVINITTQNSRKP